MDDNIYMLTNLTNKINFQRGGDSSVNWLNWISWSDVNQFGIRKNHKS